jgi:hypothetical protein
MKWVNVEKKRDLLAPPPQYPPRYERRKYDYEHDAEQKLPTIFGPHAAQVFVPSSGKSTNKTHG